MITIYYLVAPLVTISLTCISHYEVQILKTDIQPFNLKYFLNFYVARVSTIMAIPIAGHVNSKPYFYQSIKVLFPNSLKYKAIA